MVNVGTVSPFLIGTVPVPTYLHIYIPEINLLHTFPEEKKTLFAYQVLSSRFFQPETEVLIFVFALLPVHSQFPQKNLR